MKEASRSFQIGALLRITQIIGDPKAEPPIQPIIPVSRSHWWAGVKDGRFPKGIKLSERVTVWRSEDIARLLINASQQQAA